MIITLSKYSNVSETKNGQFGIRLRAETGSDKFVKQFMRENDGERPSREQRDEHSSWQSLYVFSDNKDVLVRLLNKLRHGQRHSMVAQFNRPPQEWEGTYTDTETGEILAAQNLSSQAKYVGIWDEKSDCFVPLPAYVLK